MIVRKLQDIEGTEREIKTPNWVSRRLLLADDQMGYSFHITTIYAGTETHIWYKNHLEAVYCMEGEGEVELIPSGEKFQITPGTIYALDKNDRHYLRASKDLHLACVFGPALTGREVHDKEGVYPLIKVDVEKVDVEIKEPKDGSNPSGQES